MRMTLFLVLVSLATACVDMTSDEGESATEIKVDPTKDLLEPSYVNGTLCQIDFVGALTSKTEVYQIWPVGTKGIVDDTYNTPRPNLYAIFGTGRPAFETHHVAGYDQFDHYHIAENAHGGTSVDNTKWDLLVLFPGPNFDPATYVSAKTPTELAAQSAAGLLTKVMTLPEAGFPELVLYAPIICP
jgi:hypothetical protein